jgi:hypothetical protein
MKMITTIALAIALAASCSSNSDDPKDSSTDPYDTYIANAPKTEPTLSREDAQARARLGCGQDWAPGTIDAILADAYKDLCP